MDLLNETKELCSRYFIKPSRSKGQNFLVNSEIYDRIVEIADLDSTDTVLEVGPGFGFLTERLARKAKEVIAVEMDDLLAKALRLKIKNTGLDNVCLVNGDILKLEIGNWKLEEINSNFQLPVTSYKIAANLPYNITSLFLRQYLSAENKPQSMVLMLQKEVAERITAQPPKMSLLAVSVQFYAQASIAEYVDKNEFWPAPAVDSAITKLILQPVPKTVLGKDRDFFRLVKVGFSARRKMLKNNLAAGYQIKTEKAADWLKLAGLAENIRAQELSVNDWLKLFAGIEQIML